MSYLKNAIPFLACAERDSKVGAGKANYLYSWMVFRVHIGGKGSNEDCPQRKPPNLSAK